AGGVAMAAARDPAVVGQGIGNDQGEAGKDEREPCKASEHGYVPFVVPARQPIKSRLNWVDRMRRRGYKTSGHREPPTASLPTGAFRTTGFRLRHHCQPSRFMQSRSDRQSRVGHKAPMVF